MGLLDSYRAAAANRHAEDEEEKKKQPAESGLLAAYHAAQNAQTEPKEQTPKPASASDYESMQLPTAEQWAQRIVGGIQKAKDWVANLPAAKTEQPTMIAGKPVIQPPAEPQTGGTHSSGKIEPTDSFTHSSGKLDDTSRIDYAAERRAAQKEAAAFTPTSDMYLSPVTATAAGQMQTLTDRAAERAKDAADREEKNKTALELQREKRAEAYRDAFAEARTAQPTSDMYLHPATAETAAAMQKQQDAAMEKAAEEDKKLREMGGRAGVLQGLQTAGENLAAGGANAVRGIVNALGYAGQEMTKGQLMEQQSVMSGLPGQQKIADSSAKTLEEVNERGLQSYADPALNGVQKVIGAIGDAQKQARANQRAGAFRAAGMDDVAEKIVQETKTEQSEEVTPWSKRVDDFIKTAAEHSGASGKVGKAFAAVANGVGGMVPSILSNLVVPGSGMWVMTAQAAGNATEEALAKGVNDEIAVLYGGAVGAVEALTEKITGGIPGLGVGALDDVAESMIKKAVSNEAVQKGLMLLVQALGEGVEEFVSEFADYGLDRLLIRSDDRSLGEVRKDAWYSALIGALTGFAMQTSTEALKRMTPQQIAQQIARRTEQSLRGDQGTNDAKLAEAKYQAMQLPTAEQTKNVEAAGAEAIALPDPAKVAGNEKAAPEGAADLALPEPEDVVQGTQAEKQTTKAEIDYAVEDYVGSNIDGIRSDLKDNPRGIIRIFAGERAGFVRQLSDGTYESGTEGVGSGGFVPNENTIKTNSLEEALAAQYRYMLENGGEEGARMVQKHADKAKAKAPQQAQNAAPEGTKDLALPDPAKVAGNEKAAPEGTAEDAELPEVDKNVNKADAKELIRKLQDSRPELEGEPTVATLTGAEFQKEGGKLTEQVGAFFKKLGNLVHRNGLGDVIIDTRGVKNDIAHGIGRAKAATFAAVPSVIEQGKQIDFRPNWKGRGYDSYVFAAPIDMAGKKRYVAAVVLSDQNNRFYLHEVIDEDGNLIYKIETPADIKTGVTAQDGVTGAAEVSKNNIPQQGAGVKTGLELPQVPTPEQTAKGAPQQTAQQTRDLSLPNPEEIAQDDSWRREKTLEEEAAEREAEEREYRAQKAAEDEEAEIARLEQEGKQMETTPVQKAPRSRAELKKRLQEIFSIQMGNRGRVNELADVIAEKIQKGEEIPDEMAERLFNAIYEKGSYTRQADDYFRNFRDTVKGTRMYVSPEVRAEFGDDWKAFASRARKAGITLTDNVNDGDIDVHAAELAQIYRGIDPEETDLAAQLEKIVDTAERGKGETLTQAEMEDVLRGEYGNDFVQQRMEEMERKFRQALELFGQSAGTETEVRAKADERIKKAQESAKALVKKQMEKRALSELQNKTLKQLQWLSKNRNRTDSEMRARFDEVLRNIDTIAVGTANEMHVDKASGKTWRELADLYKKAKDSDPNFLPSKQLEEIVMRLDGDKIGEMDVSALQDLYKAAIGLRTEYYNRNNVINDELGRTFAEAYDSSVDEIRAVKGAEKGETTASKWFNREQLTPINYLKRLVGWKKNSTFASFGKQMEEGERAYKKYVTDATKQLESFMRENADWVRKADGQGKDAIWYEYEVPKEFTRNGIGEPPTYSQETVKVYMTPAQKVHLALEVENYDNLRHMEGGRTFADRELYSKGKRAEAFAAGTTVKMSPEWAKRIASDLTPQEKALKNALSKYYNEYAKGEINRVSNALYGYDRATTGQYAPIFTNQNYVGHQPGITDTTAEGVGHMKSRQVSKNPSYNIGAFDAFERHTDQTARFVGYAIPIRNMNTLMNWRTGDTSLRDVIDHKWKGAKANEYIDGLLTDLQTTKYSETGSVQGLVNNLLSNYISGVFGANPGIVLKQAASFPQAGAILGFDTLPTPKQLLNVDRELIGKYTPELDYRQLGYATPETATLKNNPGLLQRNKVLNFLFGGGAITAMDGATVRSIWPWAENYVSKNFPKLEKGTQEQIDAGESPFYRKVAEVFNEAVSTTQPMYDTMHRAKIMTTKDGADRAFTMFKTVPLQQYNTLRQAFGELQAAKDSDNAAERKAAARKTANAVTATLASTVMLEGVELLNQAWKNGAKQYRDDDDELTAESVGKKVAERAVKDLAGMTIGGSELSELIFNKINGKKWYGIEIPGGEQLNDVIDTFLEAGEAATKFVSDGADVLTNGGDLGEYYRANGGEYAKALKDTAEKFAMYFKGLPVQNVEKYLAGALRIASPELYAQIGDLLETPDRDALKKTEERMLPTRIRDMLEQRIGGVPDGSADELARLYGLYGSSVALPDVPTSISIKTDDDTTESRKLSAYDRQIYEKALNGALRIPIAGLATDKDFQALDDDAKEDYLKRLYSAAKDWAEASVDKGAGGTYSEKITELRRAGASMTTIMQALAMKAALSPAEFAAWVEDDRFKGNALQAAKDTLDVKSEYDTLKATGLEDQEIFTVADALDSIAGEKSKWKKLDAIAGLDLPQESIDKAASVYLSEREYDAYQTSGMELGEYADSMSRAKRIDGNAKGRKDAEGETITGTKKVEVMRGVDKLKISENAKLALLDALGHKTDGYDKVRNWMSLTEYADALQIKYLATGKQDEKGETVDGSKQLEVMQGVDRLKLTAKQKTAVMEAMGYKFDKKAPPIWDTDFKTKDYEDYYYLSESSRGMYDKYCDWMDVGMYADTAAFKNETHDVKDSNGKTTVSRQSQVIAYIDALKLLDDQKTALYVALGYNENLTDKGFKDCPWWNKLALRTKYYPTK